jgi:hypothetical protein
MRGIGYGASAFGRINRHCFDTFYLGMAGTMLGGLLFSAGRKRSQQETELHHHAL